MSDLIGLKIWRLFDDKRARLEGTVEAVAYDKHDGWQLLVHTPRGSLLELGCCVELTTKVPAGYEEV